MLCLSLSPLACRKEADKPSTEKPPDQTQPASNPPAAEVRSVSPVIRAEMSQEFLDLLKDAKDCRGIRLAANAKASADFRVLMSYARADTPEMEEQWLWTVFEIRPNAENELRAAGTENSAVDAVKALCMSVSSSFNAGREKTGR